AARTPVNSTWRPRGDASIPLPLPLARACGSGGAQDWHARARSRRFCRHGGGHAPGAAADGERADTDDTDSQLSFSNASSPSQDVGDSRDSEAHEGDGGGGGGGGGGAAEALTGRGPCKISRQLVQDTLLDEGLRVVKEMVASQDEISDREKSVLRRSSCDSHQENKVQVIASSGGNIIAVANPALSMSPAIASESVDRSFPTFLQGGSSLVLKQEVVSPVPSPAVPNTKTE
ncbi:Uncharacterized protein GBIM_03721, partial [Gryllus bimaculatus]